MAKPNPYVADGSSEKDDEAGEEVEEQESKMNQRRCVINPKSVFSQRWDNLMIILLAFTAIVTPFEVAFIMGRNWPLFVVNRIVDFGFMCDMVVNFFLGYYDDEKATMIWVHSKIAKRYLTSWFAIDLVSIFPFDTIALVIDSPELSNLAILRVIRLLRLIKLLRILRSSRVLKRIMSQSGFSFSTWSLINMLSATIILIHWTACAWGLVPSLDTDTNNWYKLSGIQLSGMWEKYLASFEFSMMIMVMGYGDFTPASTTERLVAVILMMICGSFYAYIIGAICGVLSDRDPATSEYQQNVDLLNDYMTEIKLPKPMRTKLREFFTHCKGTFRTKFYTQVLENMSPELQGEVARHSHSSWLHEISFFNAKNAEERDRFVIAVALKLDPAAFAPNEMTYREGDIADSMFVIQRGMAATEGRVMTSGRFFGEDMIMDGSRRHAGVRALTYLDVYILTKEDLDDILEHGDYPETKKLIRKQVIRLCLRKKFMSILNLVRSTRGLSKRPKEEYEEWKKEMEKKNSKKRALRSSDVEEVVEEDMKKEGEEQQDDDETLKESEEELDFWLQGHITGEKREREAEVSDDDNPIVAINELQSRMTDLESQMSSLLKNIKEGFETMEASQEVAFRAFYNAQKRQRNAAAASAATTSSTGLPGTPQR